MRKVAANYIFPISGEPLKNGIIVFEDDGTIVDIIDTEGDLREIASLEYHSGILVPGFVNTHCHLELSCLKGKIEKHTQLGGFITSLQQIREDKTNIESAIRNADILMRKNGIVAVGDISNDEASFEVKQQSAIQYHTFVELFGSNEQQAEAIFNYAENLVSQAEVKYHLSASITPHAPYSVSQRLFKLIYQRTLANEDIISIHNQESDEENLLFQKKEGELLKNLEQLGADFSKWHSTEKNSLPSIINNLPKENNILLVHNTVSTEEDIDIAIRHLNNSYWALCPNSNLYIENRLPDINMLYQKGLNITIGTDSLASNGNLSIMSELITIHQHFPDIPLLELIKWATLNGAKALKFDNELGSLEIGKKSGINLIEHVDLTTMKLTEKSRVRVIV